MSAPTPTEYPVTLTTAAKMHEEMVSRGWTPPPGAGDALRAEVVLTRVLMGAFDGITYGRALTAAQAVLEEGRWIPR